MFAVVYLPQFALQAALRHEPELWAKAIALVDPECTIPVVCDETKQAHAAGVRKGLTPTQALARCGTLAVRHRSTSLETAANEALLQCAFSFSPHIEATEPGLCTLDLRGLAVLSDADSTELFRWAERLRATVANLNLQARIGLGATPNVARQAAFWAKEIEIISDPDGFIANLPVAALAPSSDVSVILHKWGIRTVGEFLALGQEALVERLGLEALALFAAASTSASRPLNHIHPAQRFEESFEFEQVVETVEPLLFILRRFVEQLSQRLEFVGLVAEIQVLRIRLESGELLERRLRLPQPTRQADLFFGMLRTHLETLRTDAPIAAVALQLAPTVAAQKQFGLFETVLRAPQQFQETLARLEALLGAGRVGTPILENCHRPDAFRLVPPDFENAPVPKLSGKAAVLQTTPIRRFRPEVKARIETDAMTAAEIPSAAPVSVRCSVANGQVKSAVGPWRASGRWWEPGSWQREEWDVQMRSGAVLRLSRRPEGWFVEGLLD
jgi:protein ImuB